MITGRQLRQTLFSAIAQMRTEGDKGKKADIAQCEVQASGSLNVLLSEKKTKTTKKQV